MVLGPRALRSEHWMLTRPPIIAPQHAVELEVLEVQTVRTNQRRPYQSSRPRPHLCSTTGRAELSRTAGTLFPPFAALDLGPSHSFAACQSR